MTKVISDLLSHGEGGIVDRMIKANGLPYLDDIDSSASSEFLPFLDVPVSRVMTKSPVVIDADDTKIGDIRRLQSTEQAAERYQGWPIIRDKRRQVLLGWIGRTELDFGLERRKRERERDGDGNNETDDNATKCRFIAEEASTAQAQTAINDDNNNHNTTNISDQLDLSALMNRAPITIHPHLSLTTVIEIFRKLGPRVVLVEYRGRLQGLLTIKDVVQYTERIEAKVLQAHRGAGAGAADGEGEGDGEGKIERCALQAMAWAQRAWEILRETAIGHHMRAGGQRQRRGQQQHPVELA